jgi:hypothetical protein
MMPDPVRRHVIAWQSVEILRGLIRRHLPEGERVMPRIREADDDP